MKKRLFVTLLSFVMIVTMMPLQVFANAANAGNNGVGTESKATESTKEESTKDSKDESTSDSKEESDKDSEKASEGTVDRGKYVNFTAVGGDVEISMEAVGNVPPKYIIGYTDWKWEQFTDGDKVTIRENETVSFRMADGDEYTPGSEWGYHRFIMDSHGGEGRIKIDGEISELAYSHDKDYGLRGLFENCTALISVSQCTLYGEGSRNHYFDSIFKGCTNLKSAPKIIDSKMAPYCYARMFEGCTSLEEAPSLNSTELAEGCYSNMFAGCTKLKKGSDLPATTLQKGCYSNMFAGCTSLTEAPKLSATELVKDCYSGMFSGCSSLNNLTVSFKNWNDGESIPTNEWLKGVAGEGTFYCFSALDVSKRDDSHIPASWSVSDYSDYLKFKAVDGDAVVSMSALGDEHYAPDIFYQYSSDKKTWTGFNPGERGTKIHIAQNETVYFRAAEETQPFPSPPDNEGWQFNMDNNGGNGKVEASGNLMSLVSQDCSTKSVPDRGFYELFKNCTILTKAPELPVTQVGYRSCDSMFKGCTSLVEGPSSLPATLMQYGCYMSMFRKCKSLKKAPKLPAISLSDECYAGMFRECENLEKAPDLPATDLSFACYANMFDGCSKLNAVSVSFTHWNDELSSTEDWLNGTAEAGTFACCSELDSAQRDESHIPSKWKVKNYFEFELHGDLAQADFSLNSHEDAPDVRYEYLLLDGGGWHPFYPGQTTIELNGDGARCYFRAAEDSQEFPGNNKGYWNFEYHIYGYSWGEILGDVMSLVSKNISETAMKPYGFCNLFENCNSLSGGVNISADVLADHCFASMFKGCSSLKEAPKLPVEKLAESCYAQMFDGCSSISSVSVGFDSWGDEIHATDNWLRGVAEDGKFSCPKGLDITRRDESHIPLKWRAPAETLNFKAIDGDVDLSMAKNNEAPSVLYQYSSDEEKTWNNFTPGTDIIHLAKDQTIYFRAAEEEQQFPGSEKGYFQFVMDAKGGNGKIEADGSIMSMVSQYSDHFQMSDYGFYKLFEDCNLLCKAPELTAIELAPYCYAGMFRGCAMQKAPYLPATQLTSSCYTQMFENCSQLHYVNVKFIDWDEKENATENWLNNVYAGVDGEFYSPASLDKTKRDASHIPEGWMVNYLLRFTVTSGHIQLSMKSENDAPKVTYKYSSDGEVWEDFIPDETIVNIEKNEEIYLCSGNQEPQDYPGCKDGYLHFVMDDEGSNATVKADGNIESLVGNIEKDDTVAYGYYRLFSDCKSLIYPPMMPTADNADISTFESMFEGCDKLQATPEILPATKLKERCYAAMFKGCHNLKNAAHLPATSLAEECYKEMFSGCSNLKTICDLPEDLTTSRSCCESMFEGCSVLEKSPALPAKELAERCYAAMFKGCSRLTEAPQLTAEKIAKSCCESMFEGCSVLEKSPELPAKELAERCYTAMFKGCSRLTEAPQLPTEKLAESCYASMFEGCSVLEKSPELPAKELAECCFMSMFKGCSSLTEASQLPVEKLAKSCYESMFEGCEKLKDAPQLLATELEESCYSSMFKGCSSLNNITVGFGEWNEEGNSTDNWLSGVAKKGVFTNLGDLDLSKRDESHVPVGWSLPEDYLTFEAVDGDVDISMKSFEDSNNLSEGYEPPSVSYQYSTDDKVSWQNFTPGTDVIHVGKDQKIFFRAAEESQDFPAYIVSEVEWPQIKVGWQFVMDNKGSDGKIKADGSIMSLVSQDCSKTCVDEAGFYGLFDGCSALIKAPKLTATEVRYKGYNQMFRSSGLEEAPELPAEQVAMTAYQRMFKDCKSLKKAPDLLAVEPETHAYNEMFKGCTNLNSVKVGFKKWENIGAITLYWLEDVAEKGDFYCPPELDQSIRDGDHIPPGWNINRVSISFNSTAEEGTSGGYYDENGNAIENLDLSTGTTFTVTDDEKTGDKVITFTYPDSTVKKVYVKPGEGSEIKTFTPPASPIEANCEFNTTFGVKTYNVSLTSAEGSIGTGKYYNGETEISSIRVPNNTAVTAEKIDDKTVQINFDNVALITAKADEGSVIEEFAAPESPIKSDCTFSAKFMKEIHTVTFDVQGHGTAPDTQSVNYGESAQKPEDPSEEGYTFGGWYTEKECQNEFDFATPIKADTTLYAKWTINTYTVTFDVQGHGTAPDAQTVNYSDKAQRPDDPSEEGYRFDGWYQESGCENEFDFDTPIKADTTLYAKWTKAFTVTFDMNDHGTKPSDQQVAEGELAEEPESPTEEGYTFGGWYTDKECQNEFDFGTPITANTTLYAKWTINTYTVTFDVQGHGTAPDAQSVDYNDKAQKPADPSEEGYTFGGWYTEKECENEFNFDTPIKADTTLYAKWTINTYTVTFDVQGHGTAPDTQSVNYGDKAQKPADPSEEGYRFDGWYQESGCENEFDFDTPIKGDTTLYAKWTKTFTVTFDMNGHGTKPGDQQVAEGELAEEPESPTEEGYTFVGWYTEKECQNEFDFDTPITANTTLYAKWTINTYTVTFDVQGHGTAPDEQSVNYGNKAQKPADLRERGYIFGGWYDNEECKGAQFDFNTPIKADTTIYARWTKVIVPEIKGFSVEATDSKTVSVKWNKITGFDGITYELWRREGTSGAFKLVAQGTSNTYKDTKVKTDTKYYYKVRTIRTAQGYTYEGKFCKSDYAYPRLYQVTKLSAIALNAADVQLKWNANGNKNVVYQVYRSTKSDTGFAKVGTITDSKTSFSQSFTPEQSGRKYYYKVRAITKDYTGKCHYGEFSRVDFAFPRVWAVVGFEAWAPNAKCAKVYFKPLPNQNTKYWLYKSTKPTGDFGSPIAELSYKENLYTDKKVKAGHKYYYMLRPVEVINGKTYFGPYTNVEYAYPR